MGQYCSVPQHHIHVSISLELKQDGRIPDFTCVKKKIVLSHDTEPDEQKETELPDFVNDHYMSSVETSK